MSVASPMPVASSATPVTAREPLVGQPAADLDLFKQRLRRLVIRTGVDEAGTASTRHCATSA